MLTQPEAPRPAEGLLALPLPPRLLLFGLLVFVLDTLALLSAQAVLQAISFYDWFYGAGATAEAQTEGGTVLRTRLLLWASTLAFPLWLVGLSFLVGRLRLVRAAEVGLSAPQPLRALLRGLVCAVVLTPLLLGLNVAVDWLFESTLGAAPKQHPLTAAGVAGLFPSEWVLLGFTVIVVAPVREELLFRGIVQRLCLDHPWGGLVALALALLAAAGSATSSGWEHALQLAALLPVLFVLLMLPIYGMLRWLGKRRAAAIFAGALLFGAVHSFAWPTPIALFLLGLMLGALTYRSGSLLAAIILHGLFNAASFALLLSGMAG